MLLLPKTATPVIASPPPSPPIQPRPGVPVAPKDVLSVQRQQAALQQCGLVPVPRRDLSRLERELDERFSQVVELPQDQPEQGELTTAEKIRKQWQANNDIQSEKQGGGPDSQDPNDVPLSSPHPAHLGEPDSASDAETQKPLEVPIPSSPPTVLGPETLASLYPIPEALLFPDIPEEEATVSETEKVRHLIPVQMLPPADPKFVQLLSPVPSPGIVDPLNIPLPDSPSSSYAELSEVSPTSSPRENKRPPPIVIDVTANDAKEVTEEVTRGRSRSPDRHSAHSLTTKSSLPALSPTMTASSFSSIPTPRDDESGGRMGAVITRSSSGKSRSSHPRKASDGTRYSEDLDVVHETIHESPEPTAAESGTWNPNRESAATLGSASFEAFAEKREKWKMPTGVFQSSKKASGSGKRASGSSSRRSASSELSLRWSALANDFSLKPLDGGRSRSSTLPVSEVLSPRIPLFLIPSPFQSTPTPTDENKEFTPVESRSASEQPQSKMTRSKSVITSFGLKMTRKMAPRPMIPPPAPSPPERRPTVVIVEDRGALIQDIERIQDEESQRLTRLAFDF